jgi:hypothetical protein
MAEDRKNAIVALLREAEANHADYERNVLNGERDDDWPTWYASYLLENGLGDLLPGDAIDASVLATVLAQLDEDYRRQRLALPWPEFYARRLLARAV